MTELMIKTDIMDEDVFKKYKKVIDINMVKYSRAFFKFKIDKNEAYSECLLAFVKAYKNYTKEKNSTFESFLSLCIRRSLLKLIDKKAIDKNNFNNDVLSLDYNYNSKDNTLTDYYEDCKYEPLSNMETREFTQSVFNVINEVLSDMEYKIFNYMFEGKTQSEICKILSLDKKTVDNSVNRLRRKLRIEINLLLQ